LFPCAVPLPLIEIAVDFRVETLLFGLPTPLLCVRGVWVYVYLIRYVCVRGVCVYVYLIRYVCVRGVCVVYLIRYVCVRMVMLEVFGLYMQ